MEWPTAEHIETERLLLEPLELRHADEMVGVLADASLYTVIGGEPPSRDQLRLRYARQLLGRSADGRQGWLNWIARRRDTGEAIGYVQATLERPAAVRVADVAWVITPSQQRRGFASEAGLAMLRWLRASGVDAVTAHVAPGNTASVAVAHRLGLRPTETVVDGETRWESVAGD